MKTSLGFTFIELLIVISLISFLSIIGVAAFVQFSRVQTLNSGTQEVFTMLQRAKSNAQSQVKPGSCSSSDTLYGYAVAICALGTCVPPSGDDYRLIVVCRNSSQTLIPHKIAGKLLPLDVSFNTTLPLDRKRSFFLFLVLTGGVINSAGNSFGDIVIKDTSGKTRTITVDSSGTIAVD